jgi:hypothetical protein
MKPGVLLLKFPKKLVIGPHRIQIKNHRDFLALLDKTFQFPRLVNLGSGVIQVGELFAELSAILPITSHHYHHRLLHKKVSLIVVFAEQGLPTAKAIIAPSDTSSCIYIEYISVGSNAVEADLPMSDAVPQGY